MTSRAVSRVGCGVATIRSGGPPAATIALFSSLTFSTETSAALGCTLKIAALPAETMEIELLMIVEVGLVVGVIDPMTP